MPLTRNALTHKKVRSVAGGSGPGAGRLEGLQLEHDANCDRLVASGMVNTFSASLPVHSHVARPSTEEEQVAALVATGKITTSTMWRTVGAVPFNSQVVFKAAAELEAAEAAAAAEKEGANAREKAEVIAAAVAARAKRGATGDDKLDLKDLKAVVKFTHIALGNTGFSKFNTKVLCLQFLATVSPAWDTLLPAVSEPGALAPAPLLPAAALASTGPGALLTPPPATTPHRSFDVSALSQAERRELRRQLADADAADGL